MFAVIHSIPTYDNPLHVLSVHSTLEAASAAARAAATEFAAGEHQVEELDAQMLDSGCLATFGVEDDCFLVTDSVDAILRTRLD